jgi:GAF domain-containing protein
MGGKVDLGFVLRSAAHGMWRRSSGYNALVEPIPETLQAFGELDFDLDERGLEEQLRVSASRAEQLVPGLVGVSVGFRVEGLTFTLVATDATVATLDAVQYLTSGPCVDAIDLGHGIATPDGLMSEQRWHHFARASAAAGIQSTLTLPVLDGGLVISTINLYGREEDTFTGRHAALADVFGAWAPGAVTNADLTFTTRRKAEQAPIQLREAAMVNTATGILAAERHVSLEQAWSDLQEAARRAGVPVHRLASVVVGLYDT